MWKWSEELKKARLVLVCVWSDMPKHYTYLEIERHPDERTAPTIIYKDSLRSPSVSSRGVTTQFLRCLKFAKEDEDCPEPNNKTFQSNGWECGLFVARWMEARLRQFRGEQASRPASAKQQIARGNTFIEKVKGYSPEWLEEHGRVKFWKHAKAKAKAKAIEEKVDTKAASKRKHVEPTHKTLEDALKAGQECTKFIATKKGTKGCRACMGDWFEMIRQKNVRSLGTRL